MDSLTDRLDGYVVPLKSTIGMTVEALSPQAIFDVMDIKIVEHDGRGEGMKRPVGIPYAHVPDDEWMLNVGADATASTTKVGVKPAEVKGVTALTMGLVVFETNKRKCTNIHLTQRTIVLRHWKNRIERCVFGDVETEAILIAFRSDVARERIVAVRPPETRAIIVVVRQHLLGKARLCGLVQPGYDRRR